ncbi:hypothetical protein [Demetria terragena]|uniref:hypothetical protein n=1 Tax=Demetria terragena TaxID=63959 RepID=UPI00037FE425|nr:hypothetical protein [Demetria terragena]
MRERSALPEPSRRTIAKGAAWAVPVLAVASTAPAAAASEPECPSVAPGSEWQTVRSGRARANEIDDFGFGKNTLTWRVFDDNFYDASDANKELTIRRARTVLQTVPGVTYTFQVKTMWQNAGGINQPDRSDQMRAQVLVDGALIFDRLTDQAVASDGLGTTPGDSSERSWTLTFVASKAQTTFEMGGAAMIRRRVPNTTEWKTANDDIWITFETFLECTPGSA